MRRTKKKGDRYNFSSLFIRKLYLSPFLFCLIFTNPLLSRADDKAEAVNQQLNRVENEFSDMSQLAAQKESPNVRPQTQSVGVTLKSFLTTDLSQNPRPKPPSNVKTRVNTLDLASEIFYYRYQEPNPVGVTNQGPMYGFDADYAYRPLYPNFLNNFIVNVYSLQARYAISRDLEYKGSGVVKGKHDDAMEFRGLIGKDYFIGTNSLVTPYVGFGYRYLFDRGNGQISSAGYYGYDRKSHYYYLPLGGDVVINMPNHWEIGFNAEYDILLHGLQKSYLSDGNQFGWNNPNITNSQDKGFGLRGSVKFLKRGHLVDFYMEPYIRFWNIEQSGAVTASVDGSVGQWVEPKNNTIEVGSKFGIQF